MHTLDEVFRPSDATDSPHRKEPASIKKLREGDAHWATRKLVLGWVLDTVAMTIELPSHRQERLQEILAGYQPNQKRTSLRKWQQLIGELRSMVIAVPGLRGMFSHLQETIKHKVDERVRLSRGVHDTLADIRWLANSTISRPTRLYEVVPQKHPELVGATDASGIGMGGVAFPSSSSLLHRVRPAAQAASANTPPYGPVLWRHPFPSHITKDLVSFKNPGGSITNSDLELAATVVQHDVIAHAYDIRERTISTGHDNTPAVHWQRKGSASTTSAPAYLLRLQALHQRYHRYLPQHFYLPGPANSMADDASRLNQLTDAQLLAHFDRLYPQPQRWQMLRPRPEMISSTLSALRRQRLAP